MLISNKLRVSMCVQNELLSVSLPGSLRMLSVSQVAKATGLFRAVQTHRSCVTMAAFVLSSVFLCFTLAYQMGGDFISGFLSTHVRPHVSE